MTPKPGYAAGNILNMLVHLGADLTRYDFSGLSVWQAYVQGVEVRDVNLQSANIRRASFTETFGVVASIAFSLNGNLLAIATGDGTICLWLTDGQLCSQFKNHSGWINDGSCLTIVQSW